uniref:Ig-like domain-containing protein n=1 Tax=Aquila chrysaetos chrysaetos TaxID=223781 RepID=A0A663DVT9_AQUCH
MAARGSLAPVGLLWLCLAPAALLRLHQPQSVLVVEPGASVEIGCKADEDPETKFAVSWYRRGKDGPDLLLDGESGTKGRFSCTYGRNNVTLHIASAQPDDTSLYLCACLHINYWVFGSGTTLLVGGRTAASP